MERLSVEEPSGVSAARRRAVEVARALGFDETRSAQVALVATELAGNLVKHTPHGGALLVGAADGEDPAMLRIVSLDRGPGVPDVDMCLRDGYSTAGSPGTGLGAVRRAADVFDMRSTPGLGTVVVADLRRPGAPTAPRPHGLELGVLALPLRGETVSGDSWALRPGRHGPQLLVVDGLGHGPAAAEAAAAAVERFLHDPARPVADVLASLHDAVRGTRGAAACVVELERPATLRHAGVGNVTAVVVQGGDTTVALNQNGTLGLAMRSVRETTYPWSPAARLVLHTDGLDGRWRAAAASAGRPALAAALLLRDHDRGRDDATVVVAREAP